MSVRMAVGIFLMMFGFLLLLAAVDHVYGPFEGAEKYAELYTSYKVYGVAPVPK